MAITQGEAESWTKKTGAVVESHETPNGWGATATLGQLSATGSAPDEAEARYVAIVGLRKKVGKTNPNALW